MRGKLGLVIGLGVGYVLGTRAGRQRYEQIKAKADEVWNLEPVQEQVAKVKDFAASSAMKVPRAAWNGAVKAAKSMTSSTATPGQKLDSVIAAGKETVEDVKASDEVKTAGGNADANKTTGA